MKPGVASIPMVLMSLALLATASQSANQVNLDEPISMSLKDADGVEVLQSFARILDMRLDLDPAVEGSFSAEFDRVPLANALQTVCEELGCQLEILDGDPPTLKVVQLLDLELARATLDVVLGALARLRGLELYWAVESDATVTVHVKSVTWEKALAEVCDATQLLCAVEDGTLRVESRDEESLRRALDAGVVEVVGETLSHPPELATRGSRPVELVARFGRGRRILSGKIAFTWNRPIFSLRGAGQQAEMRLAWIPVGAGPGVILPYLIDCKSDPPWSRVQAFDPLPLPIEKTRSLTYEGISLDLEPVLEGDTTAALVPDPLESSCLGWPPLELTVALDAALSEGLDPAHRDASSLNTPGHFVQIALAPRDDSAQAEVALVVLGLDPSANPIVGILRPDVDNAGAHRVVVERGVVLPDSPWSSSLDQGDQELTLTVSVKEKSN